MSKTVDERVVEMRFDNGQFEKNVQTSMSTIDKLKEKLNFSGAEKSFSNINAAASKCDVSPLAKGVETVTSKFSKLEVMGVTALVNLTNSAVNYGKQIAKSLTIAPVSDGFKEYELKMGSVQTIMAGTGESLETINGYLDELNEYSDKTIYSFSDMTNNIGKFTNAGVKLKDAVKAIQGISNEAAVSGANANEASRAMYNFSQALSTGAVRLIDWKSIENANMATVEFKQQLIDTAVEMGTLIETMDGYKTSGGQVLTATQNFNDSLKDEWMTSEVLVKTLGKYSDETTEIGKKAYQAATEVKTYTQMMDALRESVGSGWAQTWEIIFGDYEEAKTLWTGIYKVADGIISKFSDSRNNLLKSLTSSNWDKFEDKINKAGVSTEAFTKKLKEVAKEHGISLDEMIKKEGSLAAVLKTGKISKSMIIETLKRFVGINDKAAASTEKATAKLEHFQKVVTQVIKGDFGNGEERVKALTKAGENYATVQGLVNKVWERNGRTWKDCTLKADDLKDIVDNLSDSELENIGYTKEETKQIRELAKEAEKTGTPLNDLISKLDKPSGLELLKTAFSSFITIIKNVAGAVKTAWSSITWSFKDTFIYDALAKITEKAKNLANSKDAIDKLTRAFKGLFSIIRLVSAITGGALKIGLTFLAKLLGKADISLLDIAAKLGDLASKLYNWIFQNKYINAGLELMAKWLNKVIAHVTKWFNAFKNLPVVQKSLESIKSAFSGVTSKVKAWVEGFKETDNIPKYILEGLINGLKNGAIIAFNTAVELGKMILEGIKSFLGIHSPSTKFEEVGENSVQGLVNGFKNKGSEAWETIKEIAQKCVDAFKNFDFGKVLAVGVGVGMFVAVKEILDIAKNVTSIIPAAANVMNGFSGVLNGVSNVLFNLGKSIKANVWKKKASAILMVAGAIALLAGSVWVLAQIEPGKLWNAVGAIAALALILSGLAFAMSKLNESSISIVDGKIVKNSNNMLKAMLAIAGSLVLIAIALKIVSKLDPESVKTATHVLGVMLLEIAALLVIFSLVSKSKYLSTDGIDTVGKTVLMVSAAMILMAKSLKMVSKLVESGADIDSAMQIITGFVKLISILMLVSKYSGNSEKIGMSILAISVAFILMAKTMKIIAKMSVGGIIKGIFVLTAFTLIVGLLIAMTEQAGPNAIKAGGTILMIAGAFILMAFTMKIIAKMSVGGIIKGIFVLTAFTLIVGLLIAMTEQAGPNAIKAGVMISLIGVAFVLLAGTIFILSKIKPDGLMNAVAAVSIIMLMMAILIAATEKAQSCVKTLIVLTVAVVLLAAAVVALSFIEPNKLATAALAVGLIVGMFAVLVTASQYAQGSIGVIITLTLCVVALSAMLYLLAQLPIESALAASLALSLLMVAFSVSLALLSNVPAKNAMMNVLSIVVLAGMLTLVLMIISTLPVGATMSNVIALSTLAISMALVCALMSLIPAAAAINGALGFAAFIGIMAGVLLILGGLSKIPGVQELVSSGGEFLAQIGYALGKFVGSIVGGFGAGVTSGLPEVADNLSNFIIKLTPFLVGIKMVGKDTIESVKNLAEAILILTGAGLLESLTSWLTGGSSIADFATQLEPLGKALAAFDKSVAGINPENIKAAAEAAKNLAEMAKAMPKENGLWQKIVGTGNMEDFGSKLSSFGEAMKSFGESVAGVDSAAIKAAAEAGKALAEMAGTLPKENGLWQKIVGTGDMTGFSEKLGDFGEAMKSFSDAVAGVNVESIKSAAEAGKALVELTNALPKGGGFWQEVFGEQDLSMFSLQLTAFGLAILTFSTSVANINADAIKSSVNVAKDIINVVKILEDINVKDFGKFNKKIPDLGEGIKKFAENVSEVNADQTKIGYDAANNIANVAKKLDGINVKNANKLRDNMKSLGKGIKSFSDESSGIVEGDVNTAIKAFNSIASLAKSVSGVNLSGLGELSKNLSGLGKGSIDSFINAFKNSAGNASIAGATLATNISNGIKSGMSSINNSAETAAAGVVKAIKSQAGPCKNVGQSLITNFANGIKSGKTKPKSEMQTAAKDANDGARYYYKDFYNAGSYLVSGFASGISANTYKAAAKGQAMAKAAYDAAKKQLDINSPSKVFRKLAYSVPEGFAQGISRKTYYVINSAKSMADTALNTTKQVLLNISDLITSDVDSQPTIRPVLDLSNISSGASRIGRMLDINPSIGVMSNINSISSMMNNRQNGANDDVITAIKDLGRSISNASGDVYNVNGVTYDDGSNISDAVKTLVRAARIERRS